MPATQRALVIGLLGPAIQALGWAWFLLHLAIAHWSIPMSARHLIYEPSFLLILIGFLISLVCVPVAIEVSRAAEEDLEIPIYAPQPPASPGLDDDLLQDMRRARRPAGRQHLPIDPDQLPQ